MGKLYASKKIDLEQKCEALADSGDSLMMILLPRSSQGQQLRRVPQDAVFFLFSFFLFNYRGLSTASFHNILFKIQYLVGCYLFIYLFT